MSRVSVPRAAADARASPAPAVALPGLAVPRVPSVFPLPFVPLVFLNSAPYAALLLHLPIVVLMHMNTGPVLTLIQQSAGPARRAVAHAVSVLLSNVVGLALGPLLVGMFSDRFTPLLGTQALGIAIAGLLVVAWAWAAWHFHAAASLRATL